MSTTRTSRLLAALRWPQHRLATELGVSQPTVLRHARGQVEKGPMKTALDVLERRVLAGEFGEAASRALLEAHATPHPPGDAGHLLPVGEKGESVAAASAAE